MLLLRLQTIGGRDRIVCGLCSIFLVLLVYNRLFAANLNFLLAYLVIVIIFFAGWSKRMVSPTKITRNIRLKVTHLAFISGVKPSWTTFIFLQLCLEMQTLYSTRSKPFSCCLSGRRYGFWVTAINKMGKINI